MSRSSMDNTQTLTGRITVLPNFAEKPFDFEANSDYPSWHVWFRQNWSNSLIYVTIYLTVIALLTKWIWNRERFHLRTLLVFWNVCLALFSVAATVRTLPELVRLLSLDRGFHRSVCDATSQYSPLYLTWAYSFSLSKVPELGDTIFIILRKRPLTFLHVYHHCTVLVLAWWVTADSFQIARWFGTTNSLIHSLMYTYYALQTLCWFKIPKILSITITFLQITQMVMGIAVNLHAFQTKQAGMRCDVDMNTIYLGFMIYVSYLVLFLIFFYNSYLSRAKKQA